MLNSRKIKELISSNKTTVKDFATEIGVSETQLHNILRTGNTKLSTLVKISKALKVPIVDLLSNEISSVVAEANSEYGINKVSVLQEYNTFLKEQLDKTNEEVRFLRKIIEEKL